MVVGLVQALTIGCAGRGSADCVTKIVGTNVASVYVRVTHGPYHTFYYPSWLQCELAQSCKVLGLRVKTSSQVINARPIPPSDVLWVALTYRSEHLPVLKLLRAGELDDQGRMHYRSSAGGILDGSRRASVSKFILSGGVQCYRGKTIHIKLNEPGKELATITFR
jgi:hypothetical protein